jgi:acyl dehydratase
VLTLTSLDQYRAMVGQELGTSSWHRVTQPLITAFAEASDDDEKIHLSPDAAAQRGLGSTIAHGLYTLSLGPKFLQEIYSVSGYSLALNYGFDRVRFLQTVKVNSRIRMTARLEAVEPLAGGSKFKILETFHTPGAAEPVCVAQAIVAYFD